MCKKDYAQILVARDKIDEMGEINASHRNAPSQKARVMMALKCSPLS